MEKKITWESYLQEINENNAITSLKAKSIHQSNENNYFNNLLSSKKLSNWHYYAGDVIQMYHKSYIHFRNHPSGVAASPQDGTLKF